ncbi:MAG: hypothetical protein IJ239_07430, partial [Eubacterium sp.]|nr:hypothetical protein [Eubacterium sp.]
NRRAARRMHLKPDIITSEEFDGFNRRAARRMHLQKIIKKLTPKDEQLCRNTNKTFCLVS